MLRVYKLSTAFPLAQYIYVGYKILLNFLMYIIVETIFFLHIVSYENCYMFLNIQYFFVI